MPCRQMAIKHDAFDASFSGSTVFTMVWAPVLGGRGALCPLTLSVDAQAEASLALAGGVDTNFEVVKSTIQIVCFSKPPFSKQKAVFRSMEIKLGLIFI